ncbi:MAG: hypothetical protein PHN38_06635 [Sulfurospirillaceae bacterium]|nr:hypothetical protein [Sulfurospirillaceae bacterium]
MSKITVCVGGKDFDIKLEGEFALKFESDFKEIFKEKKSLEPKELLMAFVQKSYDNFLLETDIKKLIALVENI